MKNTFALMVQYCLKYIFLQLTVNMFGQLTER